MRELLEDDVVRYLLLFASTPEIKHKTDIHNLTRGRHGKRIQRGTQVERIIHRSVYFAKCVKGKRTKCQNKKKQLQMR